MATELQKALAVEIVKNAKARPPKNKTELVASSGYSAESARNHATMYINQIGVQEHLKKLGFHADNAKRVVAELLDSEDENIRIKASQEVFKIEGSYAAEKNINMNIDSKQVADIIKEGMNKFRQA